MSDATLAELERRWRASGTVDDEARWLLERLRLGRVTEQGLVVAAGLGHEAARRVAPAVGLAPVELVDRGTGEACARAAAGLARAALERMARLAGLIDLIPWRDALDVADDAVACPCPGCLEMLDAVAQGVWAHDCPPDCCWVAGDHERQLFAIAMNSVAATSGREPIFGTWYENVADLTDGAVRALDRDDTVQVREERSRFVSRAVTGELLPWALGLSDPLLERIAARRR